MTSLKGKRRIVTCALAVFSSAIGACSTSDIPRESAVAAMIGRDYRIIGDVYAYGIKAELQDNKGPSYIDLIPVGIQGPEVVFEKQMPRGQTFRIQAARWRFKLFEQGTEYVVKLENSDLPAGVEVRLGLSSGNESSGVELNPQLYQRVVDNK